VHVITLKLNKIAGCLAGAAALIVAHFPTHAVARESLDGFWQDSDGEVILEIRPCGSAWCGKVAWLKQPLGPDGLALRDYRNPDPALRKRPVCGLQVVTDFKKQADGTWGDGTVYVSDEGMSFSGYAEALSPTQIKVTGYVGLAIFGASEVWTKVSKPGEACLPRPAKSEQVGRTAKTLLPYQTTKVPTAAADPSR
jgi:uncharacterized protein (DUF2147 family)